MNIEAFEILILPIKNKLFRFACRLLNNSEEAKDIVQEVMVKIWKTQEQMEPIDNWEAWCMKITKNLSLDRLRSKKYKTTRSINDVFEIELESPSPYEKVEIRESMNQIAELIAALPIKQQQIIHLRDIEGYSYQEICEILELDMNQVKVNLFRARNFVKERLIKLNTYGI